MVDWLFGSFGGSGIRSGIPLSIHPNPFKMFGDPIGNPEPPNAPNHPLTITWNAKCVIFLGNFTPKTSNYCLRNRALGFPGSFFFAMGFTERFLRGIPQGDFQTLRSPRFPRIAVRCSGPRQISVVETILISNHPGLFPSGIKCGESSRGNGLRKWTSFFFETLPQASIVIFSADDWDVIITSENAKREIFGFHETIFSGDWMDLGESPDS